MQRSPLSQTLILHPSGRPISGRLAIRLAPYALFPVMLFLALCGCTPRPAPPLLTQGQVRELVSTLQEQEALARSFSFWDGALRVVQGEQENAFRILAAGARNPLRLKVEVTHSWGRPLWHLLIQDGEIRLASFVDQRLYTGSEGLFYFPSLLPFPVSVDRLWGWLRGFPSLPPYHDAVCQAPGKILLKDRRGRPLETMRFCGSSPWPVEIQIPRTPLRVVIKDYAVLDAIPFARNLILEDPSQEIRVDLTRSHMRFNQPIPEEIFTLQVPDHFKRVPLPRPAN